MRRIKAKDEEIITDGSIVYVDLFPHVLRNVIIGVIIFGVLAFIGVKSYRSMTSDIEANEKQAISSAETIEFGKTYKGKTNKNKFSIFQPVYNYKGYKFNVSESGMLTVEYFCERLRKNNGPYRVQWRVVNEESGEIVAESAWSDLYREPFDISKGNYIIEFYSISGSLDIDLVRKKFEFSVAFSPES